MNTFSKIERVAHGNSAALPKEFLKLISQKKWLVCKLVCWPIKNLRVLGVVTAQGVLNQYLGRDDLLKV